MSLPGVVATVAALRERVTAWRTAGDRIALVPTMGALHEGHLALARCARAEAERVVVSIFVNPKQFAAGEDFASYPRAGESDRTLLAGIADLVFAPNSDVMYPPGFATTVSVGGPSEGWEAAARPGHFAGMTTVVAKLLIQAAPDIAVFGAKDWQQLQVVRQMTRDLDLPVAILAHETVRDPQGLALSSRNAYLSPSEIATARRLNGVLRSVGDDLGRIPVARALDGGRAALASLGFGPLDYLALADADTLEPLDRMEEGRPARLLVAVRLGPVRLLDNIGVDAPPHPTAATDADAG